MPQHICGGQRIVCRCLFSLYICGVPGFNLGVRAGGKYIYLLSSLMSPSVVNGVVDSGSISSQESKSIREQRTVIKNTFSL